MKLHIICNDIVGKRGFLGENGLSILIKHNKEIILFDSGQGISIVNNLNKFGIDIATINKFVLSHGHYDHSDGFLEIYKKIKKVDFYCHPEVFKERYSVNSGLYNGVNKDFDNLKKDKNISFFYNRKYAEIAKNIFLTGEIPRIADKNITEDKYCRDIIDDQALFIKEGEKIHVILGCTHSGLINTLEHIKNITGENIYSVTGGTHLINKDEKELKYISDYINSSNIKYCYFGHCTDFNSMVYFKNNLNCTYDILYAGGIIQF